MKENRLGFIFKNYTGLETRFTLHDETLNEDLIYVEQS